MRIRFIALLVLGLFCLESGAQSLPDVARRERERQRDISVGRVFTNENVATGGAISAAETPTEIDSETSPNATSPTENVDDSEESVEGEEERTEDSWHQMFAEARDELAHSQQRFQLTQQEIVGLNQRLLTESSLYDRENQLEPEILATQNELAGTEARIKAANQAIADLQQKLRRSGAPPGWGRP
jgi:chromosome segregation ATPase